MCTQMFIILLGISFGYMVSPTTCFENYDYIIVGGGTAGLAVARRIAENGNHTVLVLESGDWLKPEMDIPAYVPRFIMDTPTFKYYSIPQRNAGLRNPNGVFTVFSGRMITGNSGLNSMRFNRGHPQDFFTWSKLTNDSSWSYSNMLKYFVRAENYTGDFLSDQHGFSGPITISRPRYAPGLEQWLDAGKFLGYPITDPNGPQRRSCSPGEFSKRFGRRESSYTAYIQPVLPFLPNLRIILNTNVTQIIFRGKRAVGVRFNSTSSELADVSDNCLYANKEIILSAGSYGSPILLMRSGIGPRNVLHAAKIPIVHELPVGQNLQDHVVVPLHIIINNRNLVMDENRDLNKENWEYYKKFGDGPFAITRGASGQCFTVSSVALSEGERDWPDLNLFMSHSTDAYFSTGLMNNGIGNASIAPWEAPMSASIFLTRPKSRGSIQINPSDLDGLPVIDVGYLSDSRDVEKILEGVKEMLRIFEQTPSYRKLGARFPPVDIPMCRRFPFRTDNYWRCYIRYTSQFGMHPAGTCRMGFGTLDPDAVVDPQLRVIGVTGLRVVDASIMPMVTNSNTQAAVYGIAEKASDMILSEEANN